MIREDLYKFNILDITEKDDDGMYHVSYVGKYGELFLFTFLPDKNIWHFCCHDLGLEDIEVDALSKHNILMNYCYQGWPWFDIKDKMAYISRTNNIHHLVDKLYAQYCQSADKDVLMALKQVIKNTKVFKLSKKRFVQYVIEGEGLPKDKKQIDFLLKLRKETLQTEYKIDVVLQKEEIARDIKVICFSETMFGNRLKAIKRAKELQKEWKAEFFAITKL